MRKLKLFSLFLCLFVGLGQMWGVTITGAAYQGKGGSSGSGGNATATVDGVTITSSKAYYSSDSEIREYKNGTLTISSSSTITKIVITCTADKQANFSTTTGTLSAKGKSPQTWTGSTTSVTFTADAQSRWSSIEVTLSGGSSQPTVSLDPDDKLTFATVGVGDDAPEAQSFTITGSNMTKALSLGSLTNFTTSVTEGSLSPSKGSISATVTVTPKSGFTASAGDKSEMLKISGDDLDAEIELALNAEVKAKHTVTWNNNGTPSTSQVIDGEKPAFPAPPTSCDATSTTFIGWATAAWDGKLGSLADKTVYTSAAEMPAVTGPVEYFAVFAKASGSGSPDDYILVEEELTNWSGTYLLVNYSDNDYAMSSDVSSGKFAAVSVTPASKKIACTNDKLIWILTKGTGDNASKYTLQSKKTEQYAAIGTTSTSCSLSDSEVYLLVSYSSTKGVQMKPSSDGRNFSYYSSGTTHDFRTYSDANGFYLYKKNEVTYSDYMTTCEATTKCATPTFSPEAGTFNVAQNVTLSCGTTGATIKYTTNEDTPDANHGTVYNGAITVDKNMTIKAYAYKDGMEDSDVAEAAYVLRPKTPVISGTANFWGTTEVSITCATEGAEIYYKLNDGAETLYENPFTIDNDANVKAVAKKTDWTNSEEATADFTKIVPLSVADAIDIIENGTSEQKTGAYVTGIVSKLVEFSSEYGNYTYYISDDGTTSNQLQAFRGKDFDGAKFTAATDIALGDVVVVRGDLLYHNQGGNELNTGNTIIERTKRVVSLALSNDGTAYPVEFTKGDAFSHEHMVVTATYNSTHFTPEEVQENPACTWSGYDANTLGEQEIIVSYGGQSVKYNVTVLGSCTKSAVISKGEEVNGTYSLSVSGTQCLDELVGNVTSTVLTAIPATHYHVASVTSLADDGVTPVGTVTKTGENEYTISGIGANTTITAVFEADALSPWATVYTSNVTLSGTGGTNASKATVAGKDALKAGTSSNAGAVQITVPQGTTELHYHAYGWTGKNVTLSITGPDGVTITPSSQALTSNSGMTGDSPFTLASGSHPEYDAYHSLTLSGVPNTGATLTFTSDKFRFVIWGVNAVYPAEITLDPTSYDFGEVREGNSKATEFTITANAMCIGDLTAELTGTDKEKFAVSAISANKVTVTFEPEEGETGDFEAQLKVSCTNAEVTANLTGTGISATQPEITVDKTLVEFGSVPQDAVLAPQAVAVTLSNISTGATASISGTAFSIDPENLAASGEITITPNTSLEPGNYSEILTISAEGATSKNVTVTMTIQDKWVVTYTSNVVLSTTNGTSASNATVVINENSYEAIKAGTGSNAGAVQILVPAHTTKLHFHAAGWKGETVRVTANESQEKSLTSDDALKGSGTTYTLQGTPQYYSVDVADNAQPTAIKIAASGGYRFVIYGVNVDTYKRDVKVGNYGTLCLKNGGVLSGATLYEIAGKDAEKIYFDEVEGNALVAGKPYIFLPEETGDETTTITVTYNTTNKTVAGDGNGFYGTFTEIKPLAANAGNYVISNNQYIEVDDNRVTVPAHRAYIKLEEIDAPAPAPVNRRRVAIGGAAPTVATGIDALNASDAPVKVLIDGQLFIIRGEKMFDAKGQLVK